VKNEKDKLISGHSVGLLIVKSTFSTKATLHTTEYNVNLNLSSYMLHYIANNNTLIQITA